jgi:hypothetical protein
MKFWILDFGFWIVGFGRNIARIAAMAIQQSPNPKAAPRTKFQNPK